VVSGEAWRLFKEAYPDRDFSDFGLEASLKFLICSFDLSTFFFFVKTTLILLRPQALQTL
jgi:hypothetical protein